MLGWPQLLAAVWWRGRGGDDRFGVDGLARAFKRVASNDGAAGGDGQSIADFGRARGQNLERLAQEIAKERYRPGPLRRISIPKTSGGTRNLAIPCVRDRVVQTAWLFALADRIDAAMNPASFAYRRGRSVSQALAAARAHIARGNVWVVDADIRTFFDSVPHGRLLRDLASWTPDARCLSLAELWIRAAGPRGLPQGSPISPVLANIYLDPLDDRLARSKIPYVRYADDFVAFRRSRREAETTLDEIALFLRRRGLALHSDKTRVAHVSDDVVFLGEPLALQVRRKWH